MSLVSISGFLALITYIGTIVPTNLTTVFPETKKLKFIKFLFKNRRNTGLATFFLAAIHSTVTIAQKEINLLSLNTYFIYYTGISSFIIFTLLAITSNKFSIKTLKKSWKTLHNLTYVVMVLLLIHIWSLMSDSWTKLTGIGLCLLSLMAIIYLIRLCIEFNKKGKQKLLKSHITSRV